MLLTLQLEGWPTRFSTLSFPGERRLSPSQQGVPLGGLLFTAVVAGLGSLANAHRHKVSEFVGNWKRKAIRLAEKCASATPAASFRQRCRFWEMCVTPAPPEETDERRQLVRATFTSNAWQGDSARAVEHAYDWCFRSVSSSQLLWRTKMAERLIQEGKVDTAWQRGEPREEVDASLTGWGDQGALALEETKAPNSTLEADDHAYWGLDDDTKECDEEDDLHAPVGEVKRYEDPTEDVSMDEHDAALPDSDRHNGNCSGVLVEEEEEEEDDAVLMSSPSRPRTLEGNEDEGAATVLTEATNEDASSSLKFPGASQSIDSALLSPSKHDRGRAESQAGKRGIYRSLSLESIDGVSFADSSLARDSPPYADRPLSRIPSQTDVDFNGHFQQTDGLQ